VSKLTEILLWIKKNLFHRKIDSDHLKVDDVSPETLKNVSFNEGDPGRIFGIRRDIVLKIAIGLLCFFLIGFWFAYPKDNKKNAPVNQPQKQEVANSKNAANQFGDGNPNRSANLASRNAQVANGANHTLSPQQLAQQQIQQTQAARRVASNNEVASEPLPLPQMGVRGQYGQPYYSAPYQQATSVPMAQTSAANTAVPDKDPYSAAISFGIGTKKSADTTDAGNTAVPGNASGSSYTVPTDTMLQTGTLIPAMLVSGINSDAGDGQVIAQTETDIYDSLTGSNLLIPAGSRFIGSSKTSNGGRVNIDWSMVVLPNGGAYTLAKSSMIAIDGAGYTGLQGSVNNHSGRTISAGVLTSAIAALGGIAAGNTNTGTTSSSYSTGQLAAQGAMSNLLNSASSIFQKGLNQTATVTIPPGYEFNIFVCQGITF